MFCLKNDEKSNTARQRWNRASLTTFGAWQNWRNTVKNRMKFLTLTPQLNVHRLFTVHYRLWISVLKPRGGFDILIWVIPFSLLFPRGATPPRRGFKRLNGFCSLRLKCRTPPALDCGRRSRFPLPMQLRQRIARVRCGQRSVFGDAPHFSIFRPWCQQWSSKK